MHKSFLKIHIGSDEGQRMYRQKHSINSRNSSVVWIILWILMILLWNIAMFFLFFFHPQFLVSPQWQIPYQLTPIIYLFWYCCFNMKFICEWTPDTLFIYGLYTPIRNVITHAKFVLWHSVCLTRHFSLSQTE